MPTDLPRLPKDAPGRWLSTHEAREHLGGIQLRTLYRLIDSGEVLAYKMGRVIKLRQEDLDAYLEENRVQPGQLRHLYPRTSGY